MSKGVDIWESFQGIFKENKKNGIGYLSFVNGAIFLGEFIDNKANGLGVFYYSDGKKEAGKWIENKLESSFH